MGVDPHSHEIGCRNHRISPHYRNTPILGFRDLDPNREIPEGPDLIIYRATQMALASICINTPFEGLLRGLNRPLLRAIWDAILSIKALVTLYYPILTPPRSDPFRPNLGSNTPILDPFRGPYSGLWPVRPGAKQTALPAGCQRAVEALNTTVRHREMVGWRPRDRGLV